LCAGAGGSVGWHIAEYTAGTSQVRRLCPKPPQFPHFFIGLTTITFTITLETVDGQDVERASFIIADILSSL
jgi:hypothetical protein